MNNDQENYLKDLFFSIRENNDSELTKVISNIRKEKPETLRLILFKLQKDEDVLISEKILTADFIKRLRQTILKSKSHSEIIEIMSNDVRKQFSSLSNDDLNAKIKEAITAYETEIAKKKKKTQPETSTLTNIKPLNQKLHQQTTTTTAAPARPRPTRARAATPATAPPGATSATRSSAPRPLRGTTPSGSSEA